MRPLGVELLMSVFKSSVLDHSTTWEAPTAKVYTNNVYSFIVLVMIMPCVPLNIVDRFCTFSDYLS